MERKSSPDVWPALKKDDEGLLTELMQILTERVTGSPYGADTDFAARIGTLPPGLRAMAATHWLDISLNLDSITWHFGNFGEPNLVAETEAGLKELGLHELAQCFAEAWDLMAPLLAQLEDSDGDTDRILEQAGLGDRGAELDRRAWDLGNLELGRSSIYQAWTRYARRHPEQVFSRKKE